MFEYLVMFGARFLTCLFLITLIGIVVAGVLYAKTGTRAKEK